MILRGTSHVILDDIELMKRVRRPATLRVLRQLMWLYETRSRRQIFEKMGVLTDHIEAQELIEFCRLMNLTSAWLSQPLTVDFGKPVSSKAARRRLRRERAN